MKISENFYGLEKSLVDFLNNSSKTVIPFQMLCLDLFDMLLNVPTSIIICDKINLQDLKKQILCIKLHV